MGALQQKHGQTLNPVAADEHREAAFGDEVVVNSSDAVFLENLALRFYDGFAAERSLAVLVSCYMGTASLSPPRPLV
ncbi:hypothetical protein ACQ4OB_25075 [Pseudomonas sp. ES4]|jgi:hypothetical protein|uniref:hypothetical protein n=1 Tax=Pseudomonas sp. ES4 TaxID=3424777 RepID=UPI003D349035